MTARAFCQPLASPASLGYNRKENLFGRTVVALELNKLTWQVGQMGQVMAHRQRDHQDRINRARAALAEHAEVTPELRAKIRAARASDESWRGAEPLAERLDVRRRPDGPAQAVTLLAVDGSQIYPNRHDIAPYFLINIGTIVLRQGTGQAPTVDSRPTIYFDDDDLYNDAGHLCRTEDVNAERARQELDSLVSLAEAEREALGGDLARPILALTDGPLLPWQSQRRRSRPGETGPDPDFTHFVEQIDRLCALHVIPVGYVDRPNSANLLRTLELTRLDLESIDRRAVRHGDYRLLTDRLLLADLEPNERTGVFVSTSEQNERLQQVHGEQGGYRIGFFYINAARAAEAHQRQRPAIGRVELPTWEWLTDDPAMLDLVQQALYSDADLTRYPYTLARAHELAVVGSFERSNLETMLQQAMWRNDMVPLTSDKEANKHSTRHRR
jgi:hypothetical protein